MTLITQIQAIKNKFVNEPVKEASIVEAEKALATTFAPDYRAYVETFGTLSFAAYEWTGVTNVSRLDVVQVTKDARTITTNAPEKGYVIEELHIDGVMIWQTSDGSIYQTQPNGPATKIFDNLSDYLTSCLANVEA